MTPDNKEIEMKVFIGESINKLIKKIEFLKWPKIKEEKQQDVYYTSKYNDFIASEICLRIRITPEFEELTWKPPTSESMIKKRQYWKEEIDIDVTGQSEKVKLLLKELDFIEYVIVNKHRLTYKVDSESIVVLDFINSLGWFVEIETSSNSANKGTEKNIDIANLLGLKNSQQINVPYRDLVKAGKIYNR